MLKMVQVRNQRKFFQSLKSSIFDKLITKDRYIGGIEYEIGIDNKYWLGYT